jgi:hypothetical protein
MIWVFIMVFIRCFIYLSMALLVSFIVVRNIYALIHFNLGVSFYINSDDVRFIVIPSLIISVFIAGIALYNRR